MPRRVKTLSLDQSYYRLKQICSKRGITGKMMTNRYLRDLIEARSEKVGVCKTCRNDDGSMLQGHPGTKEEPNMCECGAFLDPIPRFFTAVLISASRIITHGYKTMIGKRAKATWRYRDDFIERDFDRAVELHPPENKMDRLKPEGDFMPPSQESDEDE